MHLNNNTNIIGYTLMIWGIYDIDWYDMTWDVMLYFIWYSKYYDMIWYDIIDMIWHVIIYMIFNISYHLIWYMIRYDTTRYDTWCDVMRCDIYIYIWYDMMRYDMIRCEARRDDTIWFIYNFAKSGPFITSVDCSILQREQQSARVTSHKIYTRVCDYMLCFSRRALLIYPSPWGLFHSCWGHRMIARMSMW